MSWPYAGGGMNRCALDRRRLIIHDYAGHPFPMELSRRLASWGHGVLHIYCADVETPRGRLTPDADDPPTLTIAAASIGRTVDKYSLARRFLHDTVYGVSVARRIRRYRPDTVISANAPPAVQPLLVAAARQVGARFVAWQQDIYSLAMAPALAHRPWPVRRLAATLVEAMEYGGIRAADALVVIAEDFLSALARHGVVHPRAFVVENWAPRREIPSLPRDNDWARRHGLADKTVFLFAGTLGLKHDPARLADLAHAFRDDPAVRVVVVSQGLGRQFLDAVKAHDRLDNLLLFDFQPYGDLPEVLATADVAVVLLEPFAGSLSVPSKVLSYFCAERPILGAIPGENLAARLIAGESAGICVEPGDLDGFLAAARRLRSDDGLRARCAAGQRRHADTAFDIDRIARRFLAIIAAAHRPPDTNS